MQEEATHPAHERAIDGCGGTAQEGEGVIAEVGHGGVGVVEVGEHDDPVVREQVRDEVVLDKGRDRGVVGPDGEEGDPREEADVGDNDASAVGLAEQRRRRKPVLESHHNVRTE